MVTLLPSGPPVAVMVNALRKTLDVMVNTTDPLEPVL